MAKAKVPESLRVTKRASNKISPGKRKAQDALSMFNDFLRGFTRNHSEG